jgi:ribonucleoside-diphosphate reductase alpha chain
MSPQKHTTISKESVSKMRVKKRDGSLEYVNPDKIVQRVVRAAANLHAVEPMRVAAKTIGGLYDGVTTEELDKLAIHNAALLISEDPEYSKLAARLLAVVIAEEVATQGIHSFSQSILVGHNQGLISVETARLVAENAREFNEAINDEYNNLFEYFGLATLYERYLLKHPTNRRVIETPQYFFMRVAAGLAKNVKEAIEFYNLIASFDFMLSMPTLFNSGTRHAQMSSCFLVDSPQDSLESIYKRYWQVAALSKWAGGIGIAFHRIRSKGSLIRGTNGFSGGIIPWLKTLDSSVAAVNQGGKRLGVCCVYLETWHADIEEFLEFRDTTGDQNRRGRHINLVNWVPDLFMKRVKEDGLWSLFDPKVVPHFPDLYGKEFEKAYLAAEEKKLYQKQVKARDLYARMMKTLAETGNGWMTFKDACNEKSNQTGEGKNIIHSSNLCTEIVEVNSDAEVAVCNLGSVNLSNHVRKDGFDFEKLGQTIKRALPLLDRVIDLNAYPITEARSSNLKWRPVGIGVMGLQDVFFKLRLTFDSQEAIDLSTRIQEEIYYHALKTSYELAQK